MTIYLTDIPVIWMDLRCKRILGDVMRLNTYPAGRRTFNSLMQVLLIYYLHTIARKRCLSKMQDIIECLYTCICTCDQVDWIQWCLISIDRKARYWLSAIESDSLRKANTVVLQEPNEIPPRIFKKLFHSLQTLKEFVSGDITYLRRCPVGVFRYRW